METIPYKISVAYSFEDGAYVARIPAMSGCTADGSTPQAAIKELLLVFGEHMKIRQERNIPMPEDPVLHRLREVAKLLNISELAREAGISKHTLRTKLQRGTPFSQEEGSRLANVLESQGLELASV